ncbi:hypothetical protein CBS101457_001808 [Exobasidium rhododendri]|nr:hypothetical protein CBS101457_001808 [Exobasidium rhododendri]
MRIVCWNCNGLRTLRQYRPWYALKDWKECLDNLQADIICFQEAKVTKKDLIANHRDMCLPLGYEAYYSLHPTKGYSGVVTFAKTDVCHARKAEMGLTGELVPDRRDATKSIGGYPDGKVVDSPLYDVIDSEGRAVVTDFGLFVLFNLYCPNETDETRREYKMTYSYALAERVGNLISMGREVIIVGDLNIAHLPIDSCGSVNLISRDEHLNEHPARRWLDQFLAPNGNFYDITRMHHPSRKAMYTCWDTVKDTRPANYGARIDYTLVTKGLLPWIKFADIQANVYGSDHCPIYVDFHDEITSEEGSKLKLSDYILADSNTKRKIPALAASSWPEFAGRRLQSFFTAKPVVVKAESPIAEMSVHNEEPSPIRSAVETSATKRKMSEGEDSLLTKRAASVAAMKKTPPRPLNGQTNLKTFFSKPKADLSEGELEEQIALIDQASAEDSTAGASRVGAALAWGSIFAPKEPPLCSFHQEPARAWTVNKAGPNHGRKFWMCSRRVGGTNETGKQGEFRCEFWKWDSDVRTKAKKQDRDVDGSLRSFHEVAGRAPALASGEKRESSREKEPERASHKSVIRRSNR